MAPNKRALHLLLKCHGQINDRQAVKRVIFDPRWLEDLDLEGEESPFS